MYDSQAPAANLVSDTAANEFSAMESPSGVMMAALDLSDESDESEGEGEGALALEPVELPEPSEPVMLP